MKENVLYRFGVNDIIFNIYEKDKEAYLKSLGLKDVKLDLLPIGSYHKKGNNFTNEIKGNRILTFKEITSKSAEIVIDITIRDISQYRLHLSFDNRWYPNPTKFTKKRLTITSDIKLKQEVINYDSNIEAILSLYEESPIPRIIIEGYNTVDFGESIQFPFARNPLPDINILKGDRYAYFFELKSWQGHNGCEDVSDLILDMAIFSRADLLKAIFKGYYVARGQRIRDDGFWEDGYPCFKYTVLNDKLTFNVLLGDIPKFEVIPNKKIEIATHPDKKYADWEYNIY